MFELFDPLAHDPRVQAAQRMDDEELAEAILEKMRQVVPNVALLDTRDLILARELSRRRLEHLQMYGSAQERAGALERFERIHEELLSRLSV